MAIPNSQLETWSHQGAIATSKAAHELVRQAVSDHDVHIFLQGSYKNDTNIRGQSDVDVVLQDKTLFEHDLSALTLREQAYFHSHHSRPTITFLQRRAQILKSLVDYFGSSSIDVGTNAIKVRDAAGSISADVVFCMEYRIYRAYAVPYDTAYDYGIAFFTLDEHQKRVINFPHHHYANGIRKHSETDQVFKPIVRIFKNVRKYLIENATITKDLVSPYHIECLLYNVPDFVFKMGSNYSEKVLMIGRYLANMQLEQCVCQNGLIPLIGSFPGQCSQTSAQKFLQAGASLWSSWRDDARVFQRL